MSYAQVVDNLKHIFNQIADATTRLDAIYTIEKSRAYKSVPEVL